jgi:protein pelota
LRIVQKDLKHGSIKLVTNSLDDLWALYNVIEKGDLVHARTTREVKTEGVGRPSSKRMAVSMWLLAEKVLFDKEMSRLRIHGKVKEAPEDLNIQGTYHTISVQPDDQLTIAKGHWYDYQLERLERAQTGEDPIIVVAIDSDESCIAAVRTYGIDVKVEIRSRLPGKRESQKREEALERYFTEVCKALERTITGKTGTIVIVGPSLTKEGLFKYLKNDFPNTAERVVSVKSVSSGGVSGVYEALRCGLIGSIAKHARIAKETEVVEEVFARLGASRGDVSYGFSEVESDASSGAVETLLISHQTLRDEDEEGRKRIEQIMRNVESRNGRVHLISAEHEGGKKLVSIGGMAALLRYSKH